MAANKSQGSYYSLFLVAATVLCAGIFFWSGGMGKLLFIVGVVGVVASLFGMLSIKSLEGKTALKSSPLAMKLIGAGCSALGWVITLFGMHLTPSLVGRGDSGPDRHWRKPFRDHRDFACGLQQERGLEELEAPASQPLPT